MEAKDGRPPQAARRRRKAGGRPRTRDGDLGPEALRSLAQLAAIVESSDDAIVSKDLNGIIQTWNAGAERLFGYRPDEVVGRPITLLLPAERIAEEDHILNCVRNGHRVEHLETVRVRKDGKRLDVSITISPIKDRDGRIIGASKIARDITERKRAEEAVRQSERLYRAIGESIEYGIWVCDPDGRTIYASDSFLKLVGATQQQCGGFGWADLLHPDDAERTLAAWKECVRTGGIWDIEHRFRGVDGQWHHTLAHGVPVRNDQGQITHWAGINLDISRLKRAEEALQQAKEAAEAANVAKSRFLANMSHELRTPMNAILGMIDVALSKAINPTAQDCLRTARESADLLLAILNDLLDSAKIDSGKLELESAPFSLRRMLEQITRILSVRASEKGLYFYCRMPEQTPDMVVGDRMRLQQVLLNLAGNAVKFTERGEVKIAVGGLAKDGDACLEFAVRNTGIGVPPSVRERLFQPFAQADASMSRRFGGTGLGLSICKSLLDLMGGHIWAESEAGRGSTFRFSVRLPSAKALPCGIEAPDAVPGAACAPLRILLVEDNPANQKFATYILEDRGHFVEIAGDGQEAIFLTERNRYDVILMDVQMPGTNGLEATAAIREREDGAGRVPIIAMTAHATKRDREQCLAAGMDAYLSKPINAQEMVGLVETRGTGVPSAAAPAALSNPANPPSAPVFDAELALNRCAGREDLLANMAQCFVEEARELIPQMRAASETGDLPEIGRLGHRLKGTIAYLGANPAEKAVVAVEAFRIGGEKTEAGVAVRALEQECHALETALSAYQQTVGRPKAK